MLCTVKEIGYSVMIKASGGDTILNLKNVSPINLDGQQEELLAQHSESINCTSKLSNFETKVTETNTYSNCSRKIPATRSNDFLWEN
jgi:DnaJ-class molecular chaperone